jgi:hypothetical protein
VARRFADSIWPIGIGGSALNPESLPIDINLEISRRVGCPAESSVVQPTVAISQFRERKMLLLPGFQPNEIAPARLTEPVPKRSFLARPANFVPGCPEMGD